MNRITPERVRAAYVETGITPVSCLWYTARHHGGCALSAIAYQKLQPQDPKDFSIDLDAEFISDELELPIDYVDGFVNGFDNGSIHIEGNPYWDIGVEDGRAARNLMNPRSPHSFID